MKKKYVVITGGAGFVGSNLIKKLLKEKKKILFLSLDNYSSGKKKNHVKDSRVKYFNSNIKNIFKTLEKYKRSISCLFHFGEYSRMWFSQNFVSNPNCLYLELEPNLKLSPTNDEASKKHKILLIGQPDMPDKEVEIMRHLLNDQRDVCLYLKPHPLYPVTIYGDLSDLGINIIEQKNFFPKVDLAINYYSTLGIEYEACGIPVIWHYNLEVEEVLNEVAKYLHKNSTDA